MDGEEVEVTQLLAHEEALFVDGFSISRSSERV
jgi:hypothetical protein